MGSPFSQNINTKKQVASDTVLKISQEFLVSMENGTLTDISKPKGGGSEGVQIEETSQANFE